MVLSDLLRAVAVSAIFGKTDREIAGIQYDSRKVKSGDVFIAVKGDHVDGHDFIGNAIALGAAAVVVEDQTAIVRSTLDAGDITVIVVKQARPAMADLANAFYRFPSRRATMIGITGTNGKTTTTHIVRHFLSSTGTPTGLIGTIEYGFGNTMTPATHTTPESVDLCRMIDGMIADGARAIVMEVSSHALALDRVRGFRFASAVFTNLTQDHLDFHQTMHEYANAKAELFRMLDPDAVAIVNADDEASALMERDTKARVVRYGIQAGADVRGDRIRFGLTGTEFRLGLHGHDYDVVSPYLGMFNVYNLLAGVAVAASVGVPPEDILKWIPSLPQVRGRLERIPLHNGAVAVVDYAHTPDALQRAIEAVRELVGVSGRVITVFGCGGDRDKTKRPLMGGIAAESSDEVFVTSDNPRTEDPAAIIRDILAGVPDVSRVHMIADRALAIQEALSLSRNGDLVLLAGKGHETYQIVGTQKFPFDDAALARAWSESKTNSC